MESSKVKVNCPNCGSEMNHHADKLINPETENDMAYYDEELQGIVAQHHECSKCHEEISITLLT